MAMINCPECGKEISDNAKSCPNCGYSLKKSFKKKSKKTGKNQSILCTADSLCDWWRRGDNYPGWPEGYSEVGKFQ